MILGISALAFFFFLSGNFLAMMKRGLYSFEFRSGRFFFFFFNLFIYLFFFLMMGRLL